MELIQFCMGQDTNPGRFAAEADLLSSNTRERCKPLSYFVGVAAHAQQATEGCYEAVSVGCERHAPG